MATASITSASDATVFTESLWEASSALTSSSDILLRCCSVSISPGEESCSTSTTFLPSAQVFTSPWRIFARCADVRFWSLIVLVDHDRHVVRKTRSREQHHPRAQAEDSPAFHRVQLNPGAQNRVSKNCQRVTGVTGLVRLEVRLQRYNPRLDKLLQSNL